MFNDLIGKNKELGRFLFCERYTLPPVKNAMFIAEGQELKRGAVVDVNGVLVGTNSLMPYAVLEFDCDTRDGGKQASVFIKGEFNFDKLHFASGLSKSDMDNIVYNGSGLGIVIKPYEYAEGFSPLMVPAGTSQSNPLMNAEEIERMIDIMKPIDAMTLRFEFSKKDYNPESAGVGYIDGEEEYCTWTKIPSPTLNVWDWTNWDGESNEWNWSAVFKDAFADQDNEVSIIAAGDLSNVSEIFGMFQSSELEPNNIVSCCDLSFPGALYPMYMFFRTNLKKAPNLSFKDGANVSSIFSECRRLEELGKLEGVLSGCQSSFEFAENVKYGMLELYERLSNQDPAITTHGFCFANCGVNTDEGNAALAQIPQSWGGLAEG